ncbi:hypothetical protein [Vibrio cholerae]|uniref:hypothetical protein n=1 Tax=Vibrio cholerae TaxID=666 RepID=UPI002B4BCA45|nr:hypothetical protein [Vibrio cholerae]MCX9539800.1 hypothetical protein [Vibrio cholerae]MCX9575787.1 hypothetical protein [Vibrio cholerae]
MNQQDLAIILESISKLQPNEWIPLISVLSGTLIGGLVTFVPAKYFEDRRNKQFSEQVQNCVISEVSALIRIIESRKYVESIEEAVEHLQKNPSDTFTLFADIPPHYTLIYREQCKNLGVLDRAVARDIINFYQLIDAVVQDIKPDGTFSIHPSLEAYQEALSMFKLAVQIGKELERL